MSKNILLDISEFASDISFSDWNFSYRYIYLAFLELSGDIFVFWVSFTLVLLATNC